MVTEEKGKTEVGELMGINGQSQWMLAKNVPMEKGYEIDALDGVVLNLKLALELMEGIESIKLVGSPVTNSDLKVCRLSDKRRKLVPNRAGQH